MSFIKEVRDYIVAQSSLFRAPTSTGSAVPVFMSQVAPDEPDDVVLLTASGGPGPQYTQGGGVRITRPTVQVISRGSGYANAERWHDAIFDLLSSVTNTYLSTSTSTGTDPFYATITPLQSSPISMGQDPQERSLLACNYMAERRMP